MEPKSHRSRLCQNDKDNFCYCCGLFTVHGEAKSFQPSSKVVSAFNSYFSPHTAVDVGQPWVPGVICKSCYTTLLKWYNGGPAKMRFAIPVIWRNPGPDHSQCYFCRSYIKGYTIARELSSTNQYQFLYSLNKKTRSHGEYYFSEFATKPVPHCDKLPVPAPPLHNKGRDEDDEQVVQIDEPEYVAEVESIRAPSRSESVSKILRRVNSPTE